MPPMLFTALIGLVFNLFFSGLLPQQGQASAFKLKADIASTWPTANHPSRGISK